MTLIERIRSAGRVLLCGNGGSAANAMHFANDLVLCGINAQSLVGDVATLTALANDFGYDEVFSRQIEIFAKPGDLLIALSGSGNSPNIVKAIEAAKARGAVAVLVTGMFTEKPKAAERADDVIEFGTDMQAAERYQITLAHHVMKMLRDR